MSEVIEKLAAMRVALSERFAERDEVIEGLLACMLSGEHALLLGPVGTAKSMLASQVCECLEGARYFNWLLTQFSTPEELFGPISLAGLEVDEYRRTTTGKLPEAHIAFLDEVFKANSAILNALLSVINERVFHNGREARSVPLITVVAASNELPEDEALQALFDRFLVRFVVGYIREDYRFMQMLQMPSTPPPLGLSLTLEELEALREMTRGVTVADHILGDLVEIRRGLNERGIIASDRRYARCVGLMRAYAVVRGRDHVTEADLEALENVLWSEPEQREEVQFVLRSLFRAHEDDARKLMAQAQEVATYAARDWEDPEYAMRASIEAHTKLRDILGRAEGLVDDARARRRRTERLERILESIREIQRDILARSLGV